MTRDDAAQAHWGALQQGNLPQFVIYHSPSDFPGKYVVRLWLVGPRMGPTALMATCDTLDEARDFVPLGLFRMPRAELDDAVIVKTWF